jgi:hypothetical protein
MKIIFSLMFIYLLVPNFSSAEIREAATMENALEGAEAGTLVILDLDNTTMMPPQTLGGEEWYDYFVEKRTNEYKAQGIDAAKAKERAIDQGLLEWNQFHKNAKVVPVESDTPKLIAEIQSRGVMTMALTARPLDLAKSTIAQLKSIGIELQKNTVSKKEIKVPGKNVSKFVDGALLVGPKNNKGEVLIKFLKQLKLRPSKIIFVDNKQHHVDNVGKALEELKIPYFGRRHSAADDKIKSMDKDIVELQHKYFFGTPLSDRDAKKLL